MQTGKMVLKKFRLIGLSNRATCSILTALTVLLSACTATPSPDVRSPINESHRTTSIATKRDVAAQRPRSTAGQADLESEGMGSSAAQSSRGVVFQCVAVNGKEITLRDRGETIDYSYGYPGQSPEIALSKPRDEVTTYQWDGFGRWISYSVSLHNGDTTYTVFTSVDRLSGRHELEAGVTAITGDREVARFICRPPRIKRLEGIDLKSDG